MPTQPASTTWLPDSDEIARVILDIALRRHPALVAIEDLIRELSHPCLQQRIEVPLVHDGLIDLITSGLLHQVEDYIFATRAALRSHELGLEL